MNLGDPDQHFMLINVRSLAAYFPMPYKAVYAAAKRMLLDFSLAMGKGDPPFWDGNRLVPGRFTHYT